MSEEWQCCALLLDVDSYHPDTLDLNKDEAAASYWFPCIRDMAEKFTAQAARSQNKDDATAVSRAQQFRHAYLAQLDEFHRRAVNKTADGVLGVRELLELSESQLRQFGFADPWKQQKEAENAAAVTLFLKRILELDAIESEQLRWTELVRGALAGNMFDWGAQAIATILESDRNFGLESALDRIQKRPWLVDNLNVFLNRIQSSVVHKCAVIFVDNSGVDIVLGMLPFARELLKRGTKVLLCANSEPALNDVTSSELSLLIAECCCKCEILARAWSSRHLLVYGNGQRGPCLNMRRLPVELCEAIKTNETDLLVIEGMGRALHTNLYARFNCETLKLAVVKNQWLAQRLGGDTFAVICKYENLDIANKPTP